MPFMKNGKRDYKKEYETYQGTPEQIKNRSQRVQARRDYEKKHGDLPKTTEVDHKRFVKSGGTNSSDNLRAVPRSVNRQRQPAHYTGKGQKRGR
jgi:hypothetical protein